MTIPQEYSAFEAFENQLRTLCLDEFPCGKGSWRESSGKKRKLLELDKVKSRYAITLKDYGAQHEKTESLEELVTNPESPWNLDYSWSNEAKDLREIAVRSPWLIDNKYVYSHFKTLKIVDKQVNVVTKEFLRFENLEELTLSANHLETVDSKCLPRKLSVLELCVNNISSLEDLCQRPPPLTHLGLGYNNISFIDDYISGSNWPNLLSLDLSHNNLTDLMEVTRKFQNLPKLRNVILYGNPLALIPGYRGYTIDTLKNLSFLDDLSISADERHRYKGLAKRKEYILDEAKVTLQVSSIKGIPMPEEIKNPADQPEYPVVTRKYFIQFMYLEDKSANAEIFQIMHDDDFSTRASPTLETMTGRSQHSQAEAAEVMTTNSMMDDQATNIDQQESQRSEEPEQDQQSEIPPATERDSLKTPEKEDSAGSKIKVSPVNSESGTWAEQIDLNWSQVMVRDDLLGLRDFFKQPMEVRMVEEKILSYPADQIPNGSPPPPAPSETGKSKKDKKEEKPPPKKGNEKDDKKKKGKKEEIEMVSMPAEVTTLVVFQADLSRFLDNDHFYEETFTHEWVVIPTERVESPEVDSKKEVSKKTDKKDKGKPSSAKSQKKDKDAKSAKQGGKEKSPDKVNKAANKNVAMETAQDDAVPPTLPPLEFHISLELHHWKTAMDSNKEDENGNEET